MSVFIRFCCGQAENFTTLSVDTTFNVADYYLTQTVFRNLAVIRKASLVSWTSYGSQKKEKLDYRYFWQACQRGNEMLKSLRVLETDEDEAMIQGILSETDQHTINLLGNEHVRKNVKRKLQQLNFPDKASCRIVNDNFGSKNKGPIECETVEDYDEMVVVLKEKWEATERTLTKNCPT